MMQPRLPAIMAAALVGLLGLGLAACLPAARQPGSPVAEASQPASTVAPDASLRLPARIDSASLAAWLAAPDLDLLLLDVRTPEEFAQGHIPGAVLLPYQLIAEQFTEADLDRPIVVYCRSGNRSGTAMQTLRRLGFTNVSDFGGINRWTGRLEP